MGMKWRFWRSLDAETVDGVGSMRKEMTELRTRSDSLETRISVLEQQERDEPSASRIAEVERQVAQLEQSALTYLRRGSARLKRAEKLESELNLDEQLLGDREDSDGVPSHPVGPGESPQPDMFEQEETTTSDLASIRRRMRRR